MAVPTPPRRFTGDGHAGLDDSESVRVGSESLVGGRKVECPPV